MLIEHALFIVFLQEKLIEQYYKPNLMNLIKNWILPLIIALALVFIFRWLLFDFIIVSNKQMGNTFKKGDLVLIQKSGKIRYNSIVLFNTSKTSYSNTALSRCIGLPGDTLHIKNSKVFINRKELKVKVSHREKITAHYVFYTDSSKVQANFAANDIPFNHKLAAFGVYSFNSDREKINRLNELTIWNKKQKPITPKGLYSDKTAPFNTHFYWNTDNLGPMVIPSANSTIRLSRASFKLYKRIILQETGGSYHLKGNKVYLEEQIVKNYTFKYDYYFVLNDNRLNYNDSRSFGFIRREEISGKFIIKLF